MHLSQSFRKPNFDTFPEINTLQIFCGKNRKKFITDQTNI
jgi:hypothetical protein